MTSHSESGASNGDNSPQRRTGTSTWARRDWHWTVKVQLYSLIFILALPTVTVIAYASAVEAPFLEAAGTLGIAAVAAGFTGAFFGFLFGIPRSIVTWEANDGEPTGDNKAQRGQAAYPSLDPDASRPNTNLEQISDWLTKILVGATLTQLGHVPSALGSLFARIGSAISTSSESIAVFTGGLLIYAVLAGFIQGWIAARVWLPWYIGTVRRHSHQFEQRRGTANVGRPPLQEEHDSSHHDYQKPSTQGGTASNGPLP